MIIREGNENEMRGAIARPLLSFPARAARAPSARCRSVGDTRYHTKNEDLLKNTHYRVEASSGTLTEASTES
ncbi:hypothetical protein EVAR_8177_1 [Eumeta japonica]|uniref:Uncharacterized protein n=1 Tax=Eumeta variegata TaxID=151549 RepID=A0A4C1TII7_EUMVA|nr:hypothetical protein EVAR_8177_1 [Eumeta japonica]